MSNWDTFAQALGLQSKPAMVIRGLWPGLKKSGVIQQGFRGVSRKITSKEQLKEAIARMSPGERRTAAALINGAFGVLEVDARMDQLNRWLPGEMFDNDPELLQAFGRVINEGLELGIEEATDEAFGAARTTRTDRGTEGDQIYVYVLEGDWSRFLKRGSEGRAICHREIVGAQEIAIACGRVKDDEDYRRGLDREQTLSNAAGATQIPPRERKYVRVKVDSLDPKHLRSKGMEPCSSCILPLFADDDAPAAEAALGFETQVSNAGLLENLTGFEGHCDQRNVADFDLISNPKSRALIAADPGLMLQVLMILERCVPETETVQDEGEPVEIFGLAHNLPDEAENDLAPDARALVNVFKKTGIKPSRVSQGLQLWDVLDDGAARKKLWKRLRDWRRDIGWVALLTRVATIALVISALVVGAAAVAGLFLVVSASVFGYGWYSGSLAWVAGGYVVTTAVAGSFCLVWHFLFLPFRWLGQQNLFHTAVSFLPEEWRPRPDPLFLIQRARRRYRSSGPMALFFWLMVPMTVGFASLVWLHLEHVWWGQASVIYATARLLAFAGILLCGLVYACQFNSQAGRQSRDEARHAFYEVNLGTAFRFVWLNRWTGTLAFAVIPIHAVWVKALAWLATNPFSWATPAETTLGLPVLFMVMPIIVLVVLMGTGAGLAFTGKSRGAKLTGHAIGAATTLLLLGFGCLLAVNMFATWRHDRAFGTGNRSAARYDAYYEDRGQPRVRDAAGELVAATTPTPPDPSATTPQVAVGSPTLSLSDENRAALMAFREREQRRQGE